MSNDLFDVEGEFQKLEDLIGPETMTSTERMYALWRAANYVSRNEVSGAFVECGVWRGGSSMLAAHTFRNCGDLSRDLWLYDTFEGMPEPEFVDVERHSGKTAATIMKEQERIPGENVWCIADREIVERNMRSTGYPADRIHYVTGRVEDTLKNEGPDEISLLRLDTDFYKSTMVELEVLWPRLSPGGILIVDDYGWWEGARKAVDEYFGRMTRPPFMSRIDVTGRLIIKT
jgi:O-methyltransferase